MDSGQDFELVEGEYKELAVVITGVNTVGLVKTATFKAVRYEDGTIVTKTLAAVQIVITDPTPDDNKVTATVKLLEADFNEKDGTWQYELWMTDTSDLPFCPTMGTLTVLPSVT